MAGKKRTRKADAQEMAALTTGIAALKTDDPNTAYAREQTQSRQKTARTNNVIEYFNTHYGQDKLACWQAISQDLGIEVGNSLTQCKKNLRRIHCNIYDFVEAREQGKLPRRFRTVAQLRDYIQSTGAYFPLKEAKANPVLQWMLIGVNL